MATYKGGIPKLRFGTDLAPDQEPLSRPQYLSTFTEVIGTLSKPEVDHLATLLAKRSTGEPGRLPDSAFAPEEVAPDGRTVRLGHETRFGGMVYKTDRTTLLADDEPLPAWRSPSTQPVDWSALDEAAEVGRRIARKMLGDTAVEAHAAERARRLAPKRDTSVSPAYVVTKKDEQEFEHRSKVAAALVTLGWPQRLAYVGDYA